MVEYDSDGYLLDYCLTLNIARRPSKLVYTNLDAEQHNFHIVMYRRPLKNTNRPFVSR